MTSPTKISAFLFLALVLGIIFHVTYGALENLFSYRNNVYPSLPLSSKSFSFFFTENIKQHINELTSSNESNLKPFRLYARKKDIARLNENLPRSGKSFYIPGYMSYGDDIQQKIKIRYRGDTPFHWQYTKKSFRIKLAPFNTFNNERAFNLIHPTNIEMITDTIAYKLSKSLGLLTPDYYPTRVYLNDEDNGVHFYLSQINEAFLRKNHRMPGSIYSGDRIYHADQSSYQHSSATTDDKDGVSMLWKDHRIWKKVSSRNYESKHNLDDIKMLISITNDEDPVKFYENFQTFFNTDLFFLYFGLDTLFGSEHHDYFHNHKIYFDPYKGKFEPITWDIRYWKNKFIRKDISFYPLLDKVKRNPILEYQRDKTGYSILKLIPPQVMKDKISTEAGNIIADIKSDPYKMVPMYTKDSPVYNLINTTFTTQDHINSISHLVDVFSGRWKLMNDIYHDNTTLYKLTPIGNNSSTLSLSVSGNSPVYINPYRLFPDHIQKEIRIDRIHHESRTPLDNNITEILYPGRMVEDGNAVNDTSTAGIRKYGTFKLVPSPITYTYRIKHNRALMVNKDIHATNAITGTNTPVSATQTLPSSINTVSIHPWDLSNQLNKPGETIKLSGKINITNNSIYASHQTVIVDPGTIFDIQPGKSLIFHGKLIVSGTKQNPVIFRAALPDKPWGSLVIQGKSASGSILNHVDISGGSITTHNLVNYPGQFNIHDVDSFILNHCNINENKLGDDALHVAYSTGEINDCLFTNSAYDAIDIDISNITINDSTFITSGNDAIDLMNSTANISRVSIDGSGDKCLSIGEESNVTLDNITLSSCNYGIAVKDKSKAVVNNLRFLSKGEYPISLYQKNPSYNVGGTISGDNIHGISINDVKVSELSDNQLPASAFDQ